MTRPNAIEVESVSKRYLLGEERGGVRDLRDAFSSSLLRLRSGWSPRDEIWSLRDVSFTVAEGEALGVIGRNGAGKSTLLKILTRITEPTSGVSRTRGRVGSLLEVGTGFHPELTGRENIHLNGAILGMPRRSIEGRLDEIVEFSGVERFLDTPVKRYSSGMYLRLAFAVAAHLDADVLLVDEVLAVGDAEFQRRCLGRMADVEREGRTVVFVSHNLDSIVRLCPRSIWLDQGEIVAHGPSAEIVDRYLTAGLQRTDRRVFDPVPGAPLELRSVSAHGPDGASTSVLRRDKPFTVDVGIEVTHVVPSCNVVVSIQTRRGVQVLQEALSDQTDVDIDRPGLHELTVTIPPVLAPGEYIVGIWIGTDYDDVVWIEDALALHLEGDTGGRPDRVIQLGADWRSSFSARGDHDRELGRG